MFLDKKFLEKSINREKNLNKVEILKEKTKEIKDNLSEIINLEDLYTYIENFNFELKKPLSFIKNGNMNSDIMIIDEAPIDDLDANNLTMNNLNQNQITNYYFTHVTYWKLEKNKNLNKIEIEKLRPILLKHIELVKPKFILLLGSIALQALFSNEYIVTKIRGTVLKYKNISVICTFSPLYALKQSSALSYFENDIKLFANHSKI